MSIDELIAQAVERVLEEKLPAAVDKAMRAHAPAPALRDTSNDVLTSLDAAREAKVEVTTIRQWIKCGRLRAGGRPYRIRRGDLLACLAHRPTPVKEEVDEDLEVARMVRSLGSDR